jgi:predicted lipoprotein
MSCPPISTVPSHCSLPVSARISVVFPDPLGPTIAVSRPGRAVESTPCRPCLRPRRTARARRLSAAFDTLLGSAHQQFGPAREDNRAFAMGFWPDPRGSGTRALGRLIREADPVGRDPAGYAEVSVAARGFHALETMLYDTRVRGIGTADYRCALIRTMTADVAATAAAIRDGWTVGHAAAVRAAGAPDNTVYPSRQDALRTLFGAASSGLQFNSEARLGRPMGAVDRAYPERAEAWRSERSLRNVEVSVASIGGLALILARPADPDVAEDLKGQLARIETLVARADDPGLQGVDRVQGRIRVEAIQGRIDELRRTLAQDVAPVLGVAAGFNALDGD